MNASLASPGRLLATLVVAIVAAVGIAACGGGDDTATEPTETAAADTTTSGSGETVSFEADPGGELAYTETEVTANAGNATIEFTNDSSVPHDVVIEDADGNEVARTEVITGSSETTTADLKPGTDTFYCSVPGHREAGMEGTLTVK